MKSKPEVRTLSGTQLRAAASGKPGIDGYAAVFNSVTDLGWFKEVIKPGAFSRAIKENQDVRCLMNHDDSIVLGRTKSGTLTLREDDKGLAFSCELPDTQQARDLRVSIMRGDIDQCSFGFIVRKQTWSQETDAEGNVQETRTIEDVDLFDVSPVTYPAYDQTSCTARSLWPEGAPVEVRSRLKKGEHRYNEQGDCECQCDECQDGRHDECSNKYCQDDNCTDCPQQNDPNDRSARAKDCQCDCPECKDGDCTDCSNKDCDDENCDGCPNQDRSAKRADAKTKKVDGEDLTAECFLIVGDPEKTATWKLPWKFSTEEKTKSHLRNALARFNSLKDVSDDDKAKAWTKLVKLCKEHDIDVSDENAATWKLSQAQHRELKKDPTPDQAELEKRQAEAAARVRAIKATLE